MSEEDVSAPRETRRVRCPACRTSVPARTSAGGRLTAEAHCRDESRIGLDGRAHAWCDGSWAIVVDGGVTCAQNSRER